MSTEAKANTEVKQETQEIDAEQQQPFLKKDEDLSETVLTRSDTHEILNRAIQGAKNLNILLPTGTVLFFQLFAPLFTNLGDCNHTSRVLNSTLLAFCALSLILLNFTDSVRFGCGKLAYGFATFKGLWLVDSQVQLPPALAYEYRVNGKDFVHGFSSLLVFVAIGLSENNTVKCFFPSPSSYLQQVLRTLPVLIGIAASYLFGKYPSQRHGIGHSHHK